MTTTNATTKNATANTQSEAELQAIIRESTSAEAMQTARRELERREDEARANANQAKLDREKAECAQEERRQAQAAFELEEALKQFDSVRAEVLPALIASAKVEQALKGARERVERAAHAARSSATCAPNPWAIDQVKKLLAYAFEKVGGGLSEQRLGDVERLMGLGAAVSLAPVVERPAPPAMLGHREAFEMCGLDFVEENGVLKVRIERSLSLAGSFHGRTFDEREKLCKDALAKLEAKAAELGKVLSMCETPA